MTYLEFWQENDTLPTSDINCSEEDFERSNSYKMDIKLNNSDKQTIGNTRHNDNEIKNNEAKNIDPIMTDSQTSPFQANECNARRSAPIGLFDSGIGGLSVYLHLAQQLPDERYVYYADTKHVPYGNRDSKDIEALTLKAIDWLYQRGCKLIVIACNSASAHGLEMARYRYPQLPIVGLVPALKPAT